MPKERQVRPRGSSTMVRRQLGRKLRALREACGKTRDDVVSTRLMSHGKLEMIEYGRSMVRPGDVFELCTLYGAPGDVTDALRELASATTQEGWWHDFGKVGRQFQVFLDLETVATRIEVYQPQVVYGLLQTPEYATAVESGSDRGIDPSEVERNVALRQARAHAAFAPGRGLALSVVLGEAAVRMQVSTAPVMHRQLEHLRTLSRRQDVDLRVLPFRAGAHPGLLGAFTIVDFDDPDDPAVTFVESYAGVRYTDQPDQVDPHRRVFHELRRLSVPMEEYT